MIATIKKHALALLITTVLFGIALLFANSYANLAGAAAPSGLPATIATSTTPNVTATASLVFATSTCAARVISTASSSVMISFSDISGLVPSLGIGHWQGASTTVAYDSGQYGCGAVRIFSVTTQQLTVSESR